MRRLLLSLIFFVAFFVPVAARAEPLDLSGQFRYHGNIRSATISKLTIRKDRGHYYVHVWFYGRPDDADWGEVRATTYKAEGRASHDLIALMDHQDLKPY